VLLLAFLVLATDALAQSIFQRMVLPQQDFSIPSGQSVTQPAYCLDLYQTEPALGAPFTFVPGNFGNATVSVGVAPPIPLAQAVRDGTVEITGTGDHDSLRFLSRSGKPLRIHIEESTFVIPNDKEYPTEDLAGIGEKVAEVLALPGRNAPFSDDLQEQIWTLRDRQMEAALPGLTLEKNVLRLDGRAYAVNPHAMSQVQIRLRGRQGADSKAGSPKLAFAVFVYQPGHLLSRSALAAPVIVLLSSVGTAHAFVGQRKFAEGLPAALAGAGGGGGNSTTFVLLGDASDDEFHRAFLNILAVGGEHAVDRFSFGAPPGLVPPGSGRVWQPPPLLPPTFAVAAKKRPSATQRFRRGGGTSYATVSADFIGAVVSAIKGIRDLLTAGGINDDMDNATVSQTLWAAASSALHRTYGQRALSGNPFLYSDVSGEIWQRKITEIRARDPAGRTTALERPMIGRDYQAKLTDETPLVGEPRYGSR
jgi:hypothetical protein